MAFSIYLGVIQLILGMILRAVNGFRSGGWQYLMYPAGTILLVLWVSLTLINIDFLGSGSFWNVVSQGSIAVEAVVGNVPAMLLNVIGILGIVLVMLFNDPSKPIVKRLVPGGLGAIYGFATGFMGDALSYIRLFALGLAGGLLGNAFNQIGFMVSGEGKPAALFIVTILILILGHTINFALAALGSFVHPLRLTFVEFYKNIEFKGGAEAYNPFMKRNK
ncbi:MAG: hypothetical protein GY777_28320 [Candidatus Brocadiaceae bacterium]|nr:hypothetical protein [Candidatus Brocadiaceae bacterium]